METDVTSPPNANNPTVVPPPAAPPRSRQFLFLLALAAAFLAAWLLSRQFSTDAALKITLFSTYWLAALLTVAAICTVPLLLRRRLAGTTIRVRTWLPPLLFLLLCLLFLHALFPHRYKILNDEIILLSTSRQLHTDQLNCMVVEFTDFVARDGTMEFAAMPLVDKRPVLFPFLVSVAHSLAGYRYGNGLAVNAVLSFLLLAALFRLFRMLGGTAAGYLGVLLMCGIPLLGHNVTGGGYDVLNLLLIAAAVILALEFQGHPDPLHGWALGLCCLLLTYTRAESILFLGLFVGQVAILTLKGRLRVLPWILLLIPALIVPALALGQLRQAFGFYFDQLQATGVEQPFAWSYLMHNLGHAAAFFFRWDRAHLNSCLVSVAGAGAVAAIAVAATRAWRQRPPGTDWLLTPACVLPAYAAVITLNLAIFLAYHFGELDEYVGCRLALPFYLLLVAAVAHVSGPLLHDRRRQLLAAAGALAAIPAVYLPAATANYFDDTYLTGRNLAFIEEFVQARVERRERLLVFSPNPLAFLCLDVKAFNADNPTAFRKLLAAHLQARHDVYLHYGLRRDPRTGAETLLYGQEILRLGRFRDVREARVTENMYQRVARLVAVPDPAETDAARR